MLQVLPTEIAKRLAKSSSLEDIIVHGKNSNFAELERGLGIFQRMALVANYDECMRAFAPFIDKKIEPQHKQCLELIHLLTKKDVLGLAVEGLIEVVKNSRVPKDRAMAATVLYELYGEKKLIEEVNLTEKLVVNLVKEG